MGDVPAVRGPAFDTRGVLASRFFAYLVDAVVIFLLTFLLGWLIAFMGVVTFGLAWLLFPLLAGTGVIYSAVTVGGDAQATIGMRWLGLRVVGQDGAQVDWLIAAVHAIFFYIAIGTFILFVVDILTGLVRSDRRLLHDVLAGLTVVRV